MYCPVIFYLVSEQLNIRSVLALARSSRSLEAMFLDLSKSNHWWYHRTQLLLSSTLEGERSDSWEDTYKILYRAINTHPYIFTEQVLRSPLCTRLALAYPTSKPDNIYRSALKNARAIGRTENNKEVVALLLSDVRVRVPSIR